MVKREKKIIFFTIALSLFTTAMAEESFTISPLKDIYHDGWIDLNKNNVKDPYEDQSLPIDVRVADLLSKMNVKEKTCQMATLYGYKRVLKDAVPTKKWKNKI